MLDKKNQVDKLLVSANASILVAFFFIFQSPITTPTTKWTLLISLSLYIVSLIMLLWYLQRQPKRLMLLDELRKHTSKKYSNRIATYIEEIAVPFARLKVRDEVFSRLVNVKSEKDRVILLKSIENEINGLEDGSVSASATKQDEATKYVVEGFVNQVAQASKKDFRTAFLSPLKEPNATLKYYTDRLSFKFRRHIFVSGSIFALFSIIVEILSK